MPKLTKAQKDARVDREALPAEPLTATRAAGHTPGPWRIGDYPFDIVRSTSDDEYIVVATAAHDRQGLNRGRETSLANTLLISAAPDLLAACKEAFIALPMAKHNEDTNALLRAAIDKAEGTTR